MCSFILGLLYFPAGHFPGERESRSRFPGNSLTTTWHFCFVVIQALLSHSYSIGSHWSFIIQCPLKSKKDENTFKKCGICWVDSLIHDVFKDVYIMDVHSYLEYYTQEEHINVRFLQYKTLCWDYYLFWTLSHFSHLGIAHDNYTYLLGLHTTLCLSWHARQKQNKTKTKTITKIFVEEKYFSFIETLSWLS